MPQHVVVKEYDPMWPLKYEEEKILITGVLKDNCLAIYHIGSTSVPGLAAKPIIDIMAVVRSLEGVDKVAGNFSNIGYEYLGEFGIRGRRYLPKGGDDRTHQLHIFQADDWYNIVRHLAYRDFMRNHEDSRQKYAKLKKELADKYPYDIGSYCDGKDAFVKRIEQDAVSEYDEIWDKLYISARYVQHERDLSPTISAGQVSSALITDKGNIYVGVCIDAACSLGMCAERNAIANMITNGESHIEKIVAVMPDGKVGMPCGACREIMMQLDNTGETEILCDIESRRTVKLNELVLHWWNK